MSKDLTNSSVHRQNILNNPYALQEIERATRITGIPFEGKSVVLKEQVASFFEVTPRTVDNYIEKYGDELRQNGYEVIRDNRLKTLKSSISMMDVNEMNFVNIKTPMIGIFDFRAFLNLAMLMVESERAALLRSPVARRGTGDVSTVPRPVGQSGADGRWHRLGISRFCRRCRLAVGGGNRRPV